MSSDTNRTDEKHAAPQIGQDYLGDRKFYLKGKEFYLKGKEIYLKGKEIYLKGKEIYLKGKETSRQNENIPRTRTRAFLNFITFSLHCLRKTS
ncbi:hypothetical protein [Alloprevotella sp. OH1205_COT-284]|uniref:hypothetical protein n=1 Tax=Alloprevotella sp. OH1205_COT-284 TaxID=2491043 RepID=UPI000F5FE70E|nr:hypothetical protein [Alloprevotella sp. OH1205_COT-284]